MSESKQKTEVEADLQSVGLPQAEAADRTLTAEELKQRKSRNLAIALSLGAFIVIVFAVTVLRIGGAVANRSF